MDLVNESIIIHPNDNSTRFLKALYSGYGEPIVADETLTNSAIRRFISGEQYNDKVITMLGHGYPGGLYAPRKNKNYANGIDQFGRLIINPSHVDILRSHTCICIWCYAVEFAKKYKLHGLFSGMIISELQEAMDCGFDGILRPEIEMMNQDFANALADCIGKYSLKEVPDAMANYISNPNRIEEFNYNNLYYL